MALRLTPKGYVFLETKLSIIIPHFNHFDDLRQLLHSINIADGSADVEIIIVDDASDDQAYFSQNSFSENVNLVLLGQNQGPANARNIGAEKATNNNLLFIDSDVKLNPDALTQVLAAFSDKDVNTFIGKATPETKSEVYFQRFKSYLELFWEPKGNTTTVADTKFFGIRKSLFQELKGFDSSYKKADVEDYEFGYRLLAKGERIMCLEKYVFTHNHGKLIAFYKNTYKRVSKWMRLKKMYKQGFDDYGTSPKLAIIQLLSFFMIFTGILSMADFRAFYFFITSSISWLILTREFWFSLIKGNSGLLFLIYSFIAFTLLSIPVISGATKGMILYWFFNRQNIS